MAKKKLSHPCSSCENHAAQQWLGRSQLVVLVSIPNFLCWILIPWVIPRAGHDCMCVLYHIQSRCQQLRSTQAYVLNLDRLVISMDPGNVSNYHMCERARCEKSVLLAWSRINSPRRDSERMRHINPFDILGQQL